MANYQITESFNGALSNQRTFVLEAEFGYELPDNITVTNCDYTYNKNTGIFEITNVVGTVNITVVPVPKTFTITGNITNGSIPTGQTIQYNATKTIQITPLQGFTYPTLNDISINNAVINSYNPSTGVMVIGNPTGNVTIYATCQTQVFSISYTLSHCSGVGTLPTSVNYGGTATATFEADNGYNMPNNITVTGADYTWQQSSGNYWELVLSNFSSDVIVSITAIADVYYNIIGSVSNGTIYRVLVNGSVVSELPATIKENSSLSIIFEPNTNYSFSNGAYTATMGGVSIASDFSYNSQTGRLLLDISSVTGNINYVIQAAQNIFTITGAITNGSLDPQYDSTITYGANAYFGILPSSGYTYPAQADITITNATLTSYDATTGVGTIASPTGNVTISATCPQSQPVGYTIPAGTYYGKSRHYASFLYDGVIDMYFESGQETFVGMVKSGFYLYYIKSDNTRVVALDWDDGWQGNYRTIDVDDTTVTQDEYNAFFGCFDPISGN